MAKQRGHRYPALELRTAGWLLECWAGRIADPTTPAERVRELEEKLAGVRHAIRSGIDPGSPEKVPRELLCHEYEPVKQSIDRLFASLVGKDERESFRLLKIATCDYLDESASATIPLSRPLLLGYTDDDLEHLRRQIAAKSIAPAELARQVTADLFVVSADRVEKVLGIVRKGDRFASPPSSAQRSLVAAFMLFARGQDTAETEGKLLRILEALYRSGYDVKGVYHLARRINSLSAKEKSQPAWRIEPPLEWADVKKVCESVAPAPDPDVRRHLDEGTEAVSE